MGTAPSSSDVYQSEIVDDLVTVDDGSWTHATPFMRVDCHVSNAATALTGPVTFVAW